jgi:SAM-dependent methyltransferase
MTEPAMPVSLNHEKVEKFVEKLVDDVGTAMRGALCYIGDRLRIFKAMAATGPVTVDELARYTELSPRYLKEWLAAMVAAGYVEYNPETARYLLPPEHAAPLADETFPYFVGGFLEMIVPTVSVAPKVAEAFRTGKGVDQNDYSPEMFESIERGTAPWYRNQLIQKWLPAMPQVAQALEAGGTALDVGCGSGRAAITLSKAFPKARVFGYDYHALSIGRAIANADAECANAYFHVVDCVNLPAEEFDFISTFDVVHDAVNPLALMKSIRSALKKEGTYLMLEMNCSPRLEENANPVGRFLYAVSTLYCMTTSLAHDGAGIGAAMGEPKARDLASHAGFRQFRKLPIDDPFSVLYEMRP